MTRHPMRYYTPPEDTWGTVFDPHSEAFGPIMAAIQAGSFEEAAGRLAGLGTTLAKIEAERDHYERRAARYAVLEAAMRNDSYPPPSDYADGVRYGLDLALLLLRGTTDEERSEAA